MVSSMGMINTGGPPLTSLFIAPSLVRPYSMTQRDCRGVFAPNHAPIKSLTTTAFKISPLPSHGMRSTRTSIRMQSEEAAGGDSDMLQGANLGLIRILIQGEVIVGLAALGLAFLGKVNPLGGFELSWGAISMGCLGALPIFVASVLLEKSGIDFFRKIDQDTKLYVVQVFGAQMNLQMVFFWSLVLALNAGLFEELLFRGVIQQWLDPRIGASASLAVTSALFGLAHNPVPGASSFTEACYGANFGLLYLVSGGNIVVPIVAHVVYDLLTFLEVHQRATEQLERSIKGGLPEERQERKNVGAVVRKYKLSQRFVDMAYGVFKQLDLDRNGVIDIGELQLGLRTFGKFSSDEETRQIMEKADLDRNNVLTFDEWIRLLAINYTALLAPKGGAKLGDP